MPEGLVYGKGPQIWLFRFCPDRKRLRTGQWNSTADKTNADEHEICRFIPQNSSSFADAPGPGRAPQIESVRVRPAGSPKPTTWGASFRAGMAIRCSFVTRSAVTIYSGLPTTRATRRGSNANIVVQETPCRWRSFWGSSAQHTFAPGPEKVVYIRQKQAILK